ncbi:NfeD family protein [Microbulbifer hainanensis]|uniref:NfeD family protein n=1 Tax=Microbulbifer hainanensis TaxID=2735675 RepID=UPI0018676545|nr:nodulation protein NfeD [Microbulbifer hainanensis]
MLKRISDKGRRAARIAALLLLGLAALVCAQPSPQPHVAQLSIQGAIGPATTDYLDRAMADAQAAGARLVIIHMDTPGGLDAATRDIIQHILASDIPVATYVYPSGARAASAGTYILYASHIAAMAPATTLGAATPVQIGGMPGPGESPQKPPDKSGSGDSDGDKPKAESDSGQSGTAMERKMTNDAVAFIRGLAKRYGRNADWAEKAVREAATLTADEALQQNVIDLVAKNNEDLLRQVAGRKVELESGAVTLPADLADLSVRTYEPDWRSKILALITNPQVAYILLLIGIYGLIFEGYSPGAMVPGIVGIICLLLAFYALQVLPINYAGLALIIVGALLIVAELFVPSFGALGIGGVIALVIGSVMLIDSDVPGMQISRGLIGAIAGVSGLGLLGLLWAVGRSLRKPRLAINKAMVGHTAVVIELQGDDVLVHLGGEIWQARCDSPVQPGDRVTVVAQDGLALQVEPESNMKQHT